jgi:oleate hydratase
MKAYFIGSGIGALAGAAFLVRDAGVDGHEITIFEKHPHVFGGALDGARLPDGAYSLRGGRMLTTEHYECTWALLDGIPDLAATDGDGTPSVRARTLDFNKAHVAHSQARLIDRHRHRIDVRHMGFSMANRLELVRLLEASEERLGDSRISDWLSEAFFETNFWYMWQTTFAFQTWHSAVELKRYLHRFMNEFPRIETLGGVKRTEFNQYDSIVRPLEQWLTAQGVNFVGNTMVTDIAIDTRETAQGRSHTVTSLAVVRDGQAETIAIDPDTLVFFQNGSMTDATSLGSHEAPPPKLTKADSQGWALWEKIAQGRPEFGNPAAFNSSIPESLWESFTVTCRDPAFFQAMQALSGNVAGTGGLVTLRDSRWLMSVVLYHQPHFRDQRANEMVFWGYALHPDRIGDFVAKPMSDCSGARSCASCAAISISIRRCLPRPPAFPAACPTSPRCSCRAVLAIARRRCRPDRATWPLSASSSNCPTMWCSPWNIRCARRRRRSMRWPGWTAPCRRSPATITSRRCWPKAWPRPLPERGVLLAQPGADTRRRAAKGLFHRQHQLAGVGAGEQAHEGIIGVVQPVLDILVHAQAPFAQPLRHGGATFGKAGDIAGDEEALDRRLLDDHLPQVADADLFGRVVFADQAAQHHAGVERQVEQHRVHHVAAHVLEQDVHAIGRGGGDFGGERVHRPALPL